MRLIDADKVIEIISEMQKAYPITDQRPHARGIRMALFDCKNLVENQPTAYDVDKVVEEIEMESCVNLEDVYKEVIDIVKRGGRKWVD